MSLSPATDAHRPAVHPRPPWGWINDPNGLAFHDGHYHVFFQHNPHSPRHGDIRWGHLRSPDLIRWQLLLPALSPTPGGDDADGCFSGNAVDDGARLVAFYSANRTDRWWQPIAAAESHDGGLSWTKHPKLVIPEPPDGCTMWRDPYVWHQEGHWRMLVGAALADGRGAAFLYTSHDLDQWAYQGPFLTSEHGDDPATGWECPQYADFGALDGALIVSDWHPQDGPRGTLVLSGRGHDGQFSAGAPAPLDHGPDFYAPALVSAPDGRLLLWGWAREARDNDWVDQSGWAGLLTLPRELTLADDGTVRQQPARELLALRGPQPLRTIGRSTSDEPVDLGRVDRCFDLTARPTATGPKEPVLRLATSADGTEHLDIRLDPTNRQLVVDRDHASADHRAHRGSYRLPLPGPAIGPVELRLIIDHSIAELYLSTGQTLTLRFYPTGDTPWQLQALGDCAYAVQAWPLTPISVDMELAKGEAARLSQ
ncbi:glycoside hydrolase family 32 protein [Streptacidiphilus carbonis]|uniref:glycoside hydrolase family 32 protein n=1 Tax=Streptacidiphilus carbonis TaxID=105422 RepID=UPI0005A7173D|nr:glycoside hydrolase family 32 protein [Streptacidiphilus carbonis]